MRVVVFGSFVVDLMARTPHLPVPGETVKSSFFKMGPGGKGFNQAIAAKKAGADVHLVTKLGTDSFSRIALDKLAEEQMSTDLVFLSDEHPTGNALIMVDEGASQNEIVVSPGACECFTYDEVERTRSIMGDSGLLLTQLETNVDAVEHVIAIAKETGTMVVLNPAPVQPIPDQLYPLIDIITPNEVEASILTGVKVATPDDAVEASRVFLDRGVKNVVITLGAQGVLVTDGKTVSHFPNYDVEVLDSTGAGDAFSGGLVAALAEGKDLFSAAMFGNVVANLSVQRLGTSVAMPSREEIDDFIQRIDRSPVE